MLNDRLHQSYKSLYSQEAEFEDGAIITRSLDFKPREYGKGERISQADQGSQITSLRLHEGANTMHGPSVIREGW